MRMIFKQRFFTWFDSYDIYDEDGNVLFTVEGQLSWGHKLHILDAARNHIATVQEQLLTFLPCFSLYLGDEKIGTITKEFSFFHPHFTLDFNGWQVDGDWLEWDYSILDQQDNVVANISKEVMNWTDTYVIDVSDPANALLALMVVLAIDAEKCSHAN